MLQQYIHSSEIASFLKVSPFTAASIIQAGRLGVPMQYDGEQWFMRTKVLEYQKKLFR